jgi:hypothetical protein
MSLIHGYKTVLFMLFWPLALPLGDDKTVEHLHNPTSFE